MNNQAYRVLLVDDYEINLELLEAYLSRSKLPLEIYKALDGHQALAIAEHHALDLILLDVMLPDMSGFDICRRLKNCDRYQAVPVVMITALNDKDSLFEGLRSGADEFLTKPVDGHELNIRVRNLLKLRRLTTDLQARTEQLEQELRLAGMLQRTFLPQQTPMFPGYMIEAMYKPSVYIGGDFYDFLPLDDGRCGVLIADVQGHGAASAMITAVMKDCLYRLRPLWAKPAELLTAVNEQLYLFFVQTNNDFFITAFYGIVDYHAHTVFYSNAGQCPPVLVDGARVEELDCQGGLPLGAFARGDYDERGTAIPGGAELLFYTDGVFELPAFAAAGDHKVTMLELLNGQEAVAEDALAKVKQEIQLAAAGDLSLPDDVNVIAIKRLEEVQ